ncbi:hypothetical protein [Jeotgalibaca porci]|uniref:hypothetical protein n=1 Tax=Jeotgalibaca porci TaxID=1868793 RepID=UPI0035A080FF
MPTEYEKLPKTGYTKDTPKRFQLNAGALLENLTWVKDLEGASGKWSGDLIGATSGGSSISLVNTFRQAEIDGVFTAVVGGDSIESSEGKFEVNMIEWTANNLKRALLADVKTSDGTEYPEGYEVITTRREVKSTDYIENLAYVGTITGSNNPIIIIMHHAFPTGGLEFEPKDKQEGIYKLVFEARASADNANDTSLPVTILFPNATDGVSGFAAQGKKIDGGPTEVQPVKEDTK